MARPTKLTPALSASIENALRVGATRTAAAEAHGVARETLSRWMARNVTFRHAVLAAEATAELRMTVTLRQAGESDWRAALEWLKRRRAAEWGDAHRVEMVTTIRRMVRDAGLGEDVEAEAIAEAETILRSLRGTAR